VRLFPRSLATRTAITMLFALLLVQVIGLTVHALDHIELQRLAQQRDIGVQAMGLYRTVVLSPPDQRDQVVANLEHNDGVEVRLDTGPPADDLPPTPFPERRPIVISTQLVPLPQGERQREIVMLGGPDQRLLVIGMRMPDNRWLNMRLPMPPPRIWESRHFIAAFLLMSLASCLVTFWAVRRLTAPVRTLAHAAEALGRDVNAPPLPEDGPSEIAVAALAFNTMAARIRRFVQDRTFMLTAIGHDLRTPITRLKLRVEFIDDDEMRRKLLADIDELSAMVNATMAFGRDVATDEPVVSVDFAELVRTVLDDVSDWRPEAGERLSYSGPDHLPFRGRSMALKRAVTNLVRNAVVYGGGAEVTLTREEGVLRLLVEDRGPGIPPDELEMVFQPFYRIEASRNSETGGHGLGLPITRNIARAHGGDVALGNRQGGGARATLTLPL
jgi:signal transduction histidine kinase